MKLAAATLFALLALAAPALATTETASLGTVRAELSYAKGKFGAAKDIELKVFDGATQIADRKIPNKNLWSPIGMNTKTKSVQVRDLDGDGVGEAIFDLYTGGAHCCEVTYFYKGSTEIFKEWADSGYSIRGSDLVTADPRFISKWGSYAGSLPPLQVLRLASDATFTDVTAERPTMLRKEIREFRKYYRQAVSRFRKDPVYRELIESSVGALAADYCRLSRCATGYALAQKATTKGYLKPGYLPGLKKFLKRLRYDAG